MKNKDLAIKFLQKDVLENQSQELFENKMESEILALLTKEVKYLLDCDFNRLCNIMYRIDIAEETFKQVLSFSKPDEVAKDIAVIIWKRELQKAITRLKYS